MCRTSHLGTMLTGFERTEGTDEHCEEERCVRHTLADRAVGLYGERQIVHTVFIFSGLHKYPHVFDQCLELASQAPLADSTRRLLDNWFVAVHAVEHRSGTDGSHLHTLHACPTYDGHHRQCRCYNFNKWKPAGWRIKRAYYKPDGERLRLAILYLSKGSRRVLEAHCAGVTYRRPNLYGDDALPRCEQCAESYSRREEAHRGDGKGDEELGAICLNSHGVHESASTSNEASGPVAKRVQETTILGKRLAEFIKTWFPDTQASVRNIPEFETEFEAIYWAPHLYHDLVGIAWDWAVKTWNKLSFEEILDKRMENPASFLSISKSYYSPMRSAQLICKLVRMQHDTREDAQDFLRQVVDIMNKKPSKVNTICIVGPPSAGKTFFTNTLMELMWNTGRIRNGGGKGGDNFPFADAWNKRVADWTECALVDKTFIDTSKQVWEGNPCSINVKYKSNCTLDRTPIVVTANNAPWAMCRGEEKAFRDRCLYSFWKPQPWLQHVGHYPCPLAWHYILDRLDDESWWQAIEDFTVADFDDTIVFGIPGAPVATTREFWFSDWLYDQRAAHEQV